jgi:LytS/YehU family sensor histidine kinase
LIFLVAGYVYLIVRRRIREKLRVNRLIAELEIKALISQMNPHFVFNCLTSIQELVMSSKLDKAMHYLTQFSRLLRIVLQSSDKSVTVLSDELTLLEAYLELESLRFEGQFKYEIRVEDGIDAEEITIPSFLIQPFVENGLWHGLMHKKGDRTMTISFTLKDEEVLICRVDDNGIGRAQAARAKRKSIKVRESMGIRMTSDRIKLMNEQDHTASLEIIDKKDEEGVATGTEVVITLPVDLK